MLNAMLLVVTFDCGGDILFWWGVWALDPGRREYALSRRGGAMSRTICEIFFGSWIRVRIEVAEPGHFSHKLPGEAGSYRETTDLIWRWWELSIGVTLRVNSNIRQVGPGRRRWALRRPDSSCGRFRPEFHVPTALIPPTCLSMP